MIKQEHMYDDGEERKVDSFNAYIVVHFAFGNWKGYSCSFLLIF